MNSKEKKQKNLINLSVIAIGVILIAVILGYSFAWLTDLFTNDSTTAIGEVKIEIYDGNTKLNGVTLENGSYAVGSPYEIKLGAVNEAKPLNLKIKNAGTINGIVRCFVTISTNEGPKDHYTDLDGALYLVQKTQVKATSSNWVELYDNALLEGVYSYNLFLNKVLAPNEEQAIYTDLTALGDLAEKTIYIRLRADIVAHSGNAYQIDSAENPVLDKEKPFGVLTEEFLNIWTAYK